VKIEVRRAARGGGKTQKKTLVGGILSPAFPYNNQLLTDSERFFIHPELLGTPRLELFFAIAHGQRLKNACASLILGSAK
jgi:hypothetical protein